MPAYLYSFHGYGTWMPDHRRGFVKRGHGVQPTNPRLAAAYRSNQREPTAHFDERVQRIIVEAARDAAKHLDAVLHIVATDATHAHLLLSWRHDRPWWSMRRSVKYALTRALKQRVEARTWLSGGASRKQVRGHDHFDYLLLAYLPDHCGVSYREGASVTAAEKRDAARDLSVVERFRRFKERRRKRRGLA